MNFRSIVSLALMLLVVCACETTISAGEGTHGASEARNAESKYKQLLQDAESYKGLIPLYLKETKLFAELGRDHYKHEFIVLLSIARGIGRNPILGGMTWGSGDDWVWSFRKVDSRVLIVRKNVRFRADKNTPAATAVKYAYTDSVLFSLPILGKGPGGGDLVELTDVFMSDLPQISQVLNGFFFSAAKSTWVKPRVFDDNVEIEVAATYSSNGKRRFESVPDSRGVTINVHYSISKITGSDYKPRLADDRVGYFLTVIKDYSKKDKRDRFVRYINRWNLQKADPSVELSPPKQPIIFWLENTVPFKYRKTIREGILEWNRAFEQAGFANAVEVRQQPDNADWDPEDINYNTFRWITSSAGFAVGPTRVNPYTGEIRDADILFDADFLQVWRNEFEHLTPESISAMTGGALDIETYHRHQLSGEQVGNQDFRVCDRQRNMARQLLFGTISFAQSPATAQYKAEREKMIMQGLKGTVMHEVGHTLGLRHNFKGSTYLTLEQLNDPALTAEKGMLSSVMDYDAVNIVGDLHRQGDYFTPTIGLYDIWAIEYGYKPFRSDEAGELAKIASRSGEPQLAYATDEDTRGIDPDPYTNRWDLGQDPLRFAIQRAELIEKLLPSVVERMSEDGEDYSQARQAFNALLSDYGQAMYFVSRFVGGVEVRRSHKGDPRAGEPLRVIDAARQRNALKILQDCIFSDRPFQLPPEIYNQLAATHWRHWGLRATSRPDYPVHDVILMWQSRILDQLLSSLTLNRLHDAELKVPADEDAFTVAELLDRVISITFSELDELRQANAEYTNRKPAISSLRRNLQRNIMRRIAGLALGRTSAPEDCQTVAFMQMKRLEQRIKAVVANNQQLDDYSRAHLEETAVRLRKAIESSVAQYAL